MGVARRMTAGSPMAVPMGVGLVLGRSSGLGAGHVNRACLREQEHGQRDRSTEPVVRRSSQLESYRRWFCVNPA